MAITIATTSGGTSFDMGGKVHIIPFGQISDIRAITRNTVDYIAIYQFGKRLFKFLYSDVTTPSTQDADALVAQIANWNGEVTQG